MHTRAASDGLDARTNRSKWHSVLRWWAPGRHHMTREDDGTWKDSSGWGSERGTMTGYRAHRQTRAARRDELRLAQHAQDLREEAYTHGGREERAQFYGTGREHLGAGLERRHRSSAADTAERLEQAYSVTYRTATGARATHRSRAASRAAARREVTRRHPGAYITAVRVIQA